MTRIAFLPVLSNMFLLSERDLIKIAFTVHIFTNILYMIIYVFSKKMEIFFIALLFFFLSLHQKIPLLWIKKYRLVATK